MNRPCGSDMARGGDRQRTGPATDVEGGHPTFEAGETDDAFAELAFAAAREQPRQKVITSRPANDQPIRVWRSLAFHYVGCL